MQLTQLPYNPNFCIPPSVPKRIFSTLPRNYKSNNFIPSINSNPTFYTGNSLPRRNNLLNFDIPPPPYNYKDSAAIQNNTEIKAESTLSLSNNSTFRLLTKFNCNVPENDVITISRICSSDTGEMILIDSEHMFLFIYTRHGSFKSKIKIIGINGGAFLNCEKLIIATQRGIKLLKKDGSFIKELPIGETLHVATSKNSFMCIQKRSLHFYMESECLFQKKITKFKKKFGFICRKTVFKEISDAQFIDNFKIAILDKGAFNLIIVTIYGYLIERYSLEMYDFIKNPHSLTLNNPYFILISDLKTGHISLCSLKSHLIRSIMSSSLQVTAISFNNFGHLIISTKNNNTCEIYIYDTIQT